MTEITPGSAERDALVKAIRMAVVSWNTLGPRKAGEDVSEFIADFLIVNKVSVTSPGEPLTEEDEATSAADYGRQRGWHLTPEERAARARRTVTRPTTPGGQS